MFCFKILQKKQHLIDKFILPLASPAPLKTCYGPCSLHSLQKLQYKSTISICWSSHWRDVMKFDLKLADYCWIELVLYSGYVEPTQHVDFVDSVGFCIFYYVCRSTERSAFASAHLQTAALSLSISIDCRSRFWIRSNSPRRFLNPSNIVSLSPIVECLVGPYCRDSIIFLCLSFPCHSSIPPPASVVPVHIILHNVDTRNLVYRVSCIVYRVF